MARSKSRRKGLKRKSKKRKSKKLGKKGKSEKNKTPEANRKYSPDVFLMVRRKKTTIFIDAKEDTSVLELKRMVAGITKVLPDDQKLFSNREEMKDEKHLSDYGFTAGTAKPQSPATISLVFRDASGNWEDIDIAPLSQPPELPEVMRLSVDVGDSRSNNPEQTA